MPNEFDTLGTLAQNLIRWAKTHWRVWYGLSMRREISPLPEKSHNSDNMQKQYFRFRHKKES